MSADSTLPASSPLVPVSHRRPAAICAVAVVVIVFAFLETAASMVKIWRSSETFSHGFIVVPIALWLVWRKRDELARTAVQPFWPGLLLLGGGGFLWLLGSLADANVVRHFALVVMIQSAALVILGLEMTRAMAFPLFFLLFAVPFGEAFVPRLMDWTADFTVLALKLTGVPVYREGNNFVIPSGNWSVVEACSGVRYLIASLLAGTLYAYLMYRSRLRRVLFVIAATIVPIAANWLRAYAIVMIGHLSGNELATGVDHLIYGWIFFGIVLFALFWAGARFREDDASLSESTGSNAFIPVGRGHVVGAALAAVVVAIVWVPLAAAMLGGEADSPRALPPIAGAGGWEPVDGKSNDDWRPHFTGHRAELRQTFQRAGNRVVVSIYYYAGQTQGQELINFANVLVTTKDPRWHENGRGEAELGTAERRIRARTATLAGHGRRFDVAWWYWVDGRTTTSDTVAKVLLAWSRLRLRSDDSAAVFLFTEPSSQGSGAELLNRFAGDMGPAIDVALSTARQGTR